LKQQVSPVVAIVIIVIVLLGVGAFIYKGSQGVNPGSGKLQSDLDFGKMEKDPAKFEAGVRESLAKDKQRNGQ